MGRPQVVKVVNNTCTSQILNTGTPQGCMLSPLLYSLFTHDRVTMHSTSSSDDTTVVDLITDNDKTAYREEVMALAEWCQEKNININKTKELIVDFRIQ
jgi:hypothetical protein